MRFLFVLFALEAPGKASFCDFALSLKYVGWERWTVAFTAQADYMTNATAAIGDSDAWEMMIGMDGLFNFDQHWNIIGGKDREFYTSYI